MRVYLALALFATAVSAGRTLADPGPSVPPAPARVAAALPEPRDADPVIAVKAQAAPDAAHHAIYLELFGRAGAWGVGYDWQPHPRFAVGAAASYAGFDGSPKTTFAPYVAAYPILRGRHRGFVQAGPTVTRRTTPSPGPEWSGESTTHLTGEIAAGYEYRHGLLVRTYVMASQGDHLVPWLGASVGWTL